MYYEKEYSFFKKIAYRFGFPIREVKVPQRTISNMNKIYLLSMEDEKGEELFFYILKHCSEKKVMHIQNEDEDVNLLFLKLPQKKERTLLFLGPFSKKDYIKAYVIMTEFAAILWDNIYELERYSFSLKHRHPLIEKVIEEIESDITDNHTLKYMARKMCVSPGYLSKLFAQEMGMTLTEFINRKKMEYGAYLLDTTNDKICSIAVRCGLKDSNYFSRLFKRYMGVNPAEYRKK